MKLQSKKTVLIYGFSENYGGIEQYLFYLIDQLRNVAQKIVCLIPSYSIPYISKFSSYDVELEILPSRKKVFTHAFFLYRIFKFYKINVLHMNTNTLSYSELIYMALFFKIKIILHSHSSSSSGGLMSHILHRLNRVIVNFLSLQRIAVSFEAGNWLFGSKHFDIIHNGIDIVKFQYNANARNRIRSQLSICDDEIVLGHVGILSYPKNQKFLIDVISKLNQYDDKKYKLIFVGDGKDKNILTNYIRKLNINNICFIGAVDNVHDYYSCFDMFLFPSFFEGFPLAVLESQASNLPTIISSSITKVVLMGKSVYQLDLVADYWVSTIRNMEPNFSRNENTNLDLDIKKSTSEILTYF